MRARFAYPLVFFVPCALISSLAGVVSAVAAAGVAWVFVYGDSPWPKEAEIVITVLGGLVATSVFSLLVAVLYIYGKRRESSGGLARSHIIAAVAITILLPALVWLRQYRLGL